MSKYIELAAGVLGYAVMAVGAITFLTLVISLVVDYVWRTIQAVYGLGQVYDVMKKHGKKKPERIPAK